MNQTQPPSTSSQSLLDRRRVLGPAYRLFYDEPFAPVRGKDVWLYDQAGRQYLDAYNNVPVVGHCHPHVVDAIAKQAAVLNTHTRYLHDSVLTYAERLLTHFPAALDTVMFTCSGSEANDLALRICRAATGGAGFIVTEFAYHGVTSALADMSPSLQAIVGINVRTIPSPGAVQGMAPEAAAKEFAQGVARAIEDLREAGIKPAALIVDTVFASDGIYTDPLGLLAAAAQVIRAHGGLFIADEVQGGFGRSGGHWWAFQREAVVPDIVTLGKPMGNGHPLAGVILGADLARAFAARGRYFNTFGGNPVSAAAGMAVLDVIENQTLLEQVDAVGRYLGTRLAKLADKHKAIAAVRGSGLYRGVELGREGAAPAAELAARVVNALRQDGILLSACGPRANTLKIRPPLTFTADHVELLVSGLDRAIAQAQKA